MSRKLNLVGKRFGRLVVIEEAGRNKHGKVLWLCKCDCGQEIVVTSNALRTGNTTSCGCYRRERHTTHGMAKTRLYQTWLDLLKRTGIYKGANERTKRDYIDRGITVCAEWIVFENFRDWSLAHGYNDSLELDRIENDRGYSSENCHWVSPKENANNRRNTTRLGDGTPLALFCTKVGIETMGENGRPSRQYLRISRMYRQDRKPHPELIHKANETVALYKKTLDLLKLQEEVRRFASAVQKLP